MKFKVAQNFDGSTSINRSWFVTDSMPFLDYGVLGDLVFWLKDHVGNSWSISVYEDKRSAISLTELPNRVIARNNAVDIRSIAHTFTVEICVFDPADGIAFALRWC